MKTKLLDALLASPGGEAIREVFRLLGHYTPEIVYVRLRRGSERNGECDIRAVLAEVGEDGVLSGEAADVDFRCTNVRELAWSFDWDSHIGKAHQPSDQTAEPACRLEIDTEDRFRIFCDQIEVVKVRSYRFPEEGRIDYEKR
jgi:hypothetical protein